MMTETRVFCDSCQHWLVHDQVFCPLFPNIQPSSTRPPKWDRCVCLIHTCFRAEKVEDKEKAPTYHDFI